MGTSLLVQWLRLPSSHCRGPSSIPGQGTRSHMLQLQIPSKCSQINKTFLFFLLKTPVFGLLGLILHEARTSHELLLPWWLRRQRLCPQCRRPRINPWVRRIPWRRKWQPTPVFLPGKSHGQRSLAGYSPWGRTELDKTEQLMLTDLPCVQAIIFLLFTQEKEKHAHKIIIQDF